MPGFGRERGRREIDAKHRTDRLYHLQPPEQKGPAARRQGGHMTRVSLPVNHCKSRRPRGRHLPRPARIGKAMATDTLWKQRIRNKHSLSGDQSRAPRLLRRGGYCWRVHRESQAGGIRRSEFVLGSLARGDGEQRIGMAVRYCKLVCALGMTNQDRAMQLFQQRAAGPRLRRHTALFTLRFQASGRPINSSLGCTLQGIVDTTAHARLT